MKQLLFLTPEFRTGRNVTVRRGTKWDGETYAEITINEDRYFVKRICTRVKRFCDLSNMDISFEHDHTCTNLVGLKTAMLKAYSDFDVNEIVTIITFHMGWNEV